MQPGRDGTSATNTPSSSCSIKTRYFISYLQLDSRHPVDKVCAESCCKNRLDMQRDCSGSPTTERKKDIDCDCSASPHKTIDEERLSSIARPFPVITSGGKLRRHRQVTTEPVNDTTSAAKSCERGCII